MHYRDLIIAHEAYHKIEKRGIYYDFYMQSRNLTEWEPSPSFGEIFKLFGFILSWDPNFKGIPSEFKLVYEEVRPILVEISRVKLETADFKDEDFLRKISYTFDKIARCSYRYECTDASKILHVLHPQLFVMWDRNIRKKVLKDIKFADGDVYARKFLPLMQKELEEAILYFTKETETFEENDYDTAIDLNNEDLFLEIEDDRTGYDEFMDQLFIEAFDIERDAWEEAQELYVSPQVEEELGYVTDMPSEMQEESDEIGKQVLETISARYPDPDFDYDEQNDEETIETPEDIEEGEKNLAIEENEKNLAIAFIINNCNMEPLPKIIDEYNYMLYTRPGDFIRYLNFLKELKILKKEDEERLLDKIKS